MRVWNLTALTFTMLVSMSVPAWAETKPTSIEGNLPDAISAGDVAIQSNQEHSGKWTQHFPDIIFALSDAEKAKFDIPPAMFADFWKKWHFVGARWRQDIHEFRLTYANDLAWKTLLEQRTDYPVGAMFGKLSYPAEEDLALPSSVMPSRFLNRLLIMLWDPNHKKKSADGWTYLRFINPDPRAPQDPANTGVWGVMSDTEIKACVECHARAADRGHVFSQPQYLFTENKEAPQIRDKKILENRYAESMKDLDPKKVPRIALSLMNIVEEWKGRPLKGYEGDFFAGALGEMAPVMTKMAQKDPASIYLIYDRTDPDTLELASSVKKPGYENCAALVRLRGSAINLMKEQLNNKRKAEPKADAAYPAAEDQGEGENLKRDAKGAIVRDVSKQYKPTAIIFVTCGQDVVSRQLLPLKYTSKDSDGLPSYTFTPATIK